MTLGRSVRCDGCGATVVVEGSTRAIPENWRRLHVRQKGRENKPDTFDICSAPCATKVVELTYEGDQ